MPFPEQPFLAFDATEIERLAPGYFGCYGLVQRRSEGTVWIYVGKGPIKDRLRDHLDHDNSCINRYWPTHFVSLVTGDFDNEERRLILEYSPICNQKLD